MTEETFHTQMALDVIRVLADPVYVAKFQRACGVIYEKPEKIDQQTQTRAQPSDSDSSDHDERSQELPQGNKTTDGDICNAVSSTQSRSSSLRHRATDSGEKTYETNNNLGKTSNNNINSGSSKCNCSDDGIATASKSKKISRKKQYHTIEPTSRVYGKGSIFEYDADTKKSLNTCNGSADGKDKRALPSPAYKIKYRPLLYLAYFGAFLGNEEFYLTFFPFCIWNVDFLVVRQVCSLECFKIVLSVSLLIVTNSGTDQKIRVWTIFKAENQA